MRFYTQWDRPDGFEVDQVSPRSITELAYVPPQVMIKDMMDAGRRLAAERRMRFDSVELGVEDVQGDMPLDPTREPGVDLVDVTRAERAVRSRLEAQRELRRKAKEDALQKAKEAAEAAKVVPPVPKS